MIIDLAKITPRQKLIIAKGLCDYQYIMDNWQVNDTDFKEVYYDFYIKARWAVMTNPNNLNPYFDKLQSINPEDDLMVILSELRDETEKQSYEFSLVSKMLHTRNAARPIYDSKVRDYLSKEENVHFWWHIPNKVSGAPRAQSEDVKIAHDWDILCEWYETFLQSPRGISWIEWFDNNFPSYKDISNIKKVDFIIFATN